MTNHMNVDAEKSYLYQTSFDITARCKISSYLKLWSTTDARDW